MKEYLNQEKLKIVKEREGFIAALDQSGGSTAKTLEKYGIPKDSYQTEEEMFDLIHEMRKRVFTSPVFTSEKILGTILFYKTMNSKVNGKYTSDYLWEDKNIVSFLKVDKGLEEEKNQVKLMKEIPDLEEQLKLARERNVFGTKMRSVILGANREGIKEIVKQQFEFAKIICDNGLVPIIEPEVDIHIKDKIEAEKILKEEIVEVLNNWNEDDLIMFKFTIPTETNLYEDLYKYSSVIRIVALSGGYETDEACKLLKRNHKMIASFSRALLQNLSNNQTEEEFNQELKNAIDEIYDASIE
ncbi:MAG: fructose bisphosphate aldolase [Bacilli bacterium]|nr:fructose bisphosphate aldolase [Bacilli bacterium]